MAGKPEPKLEPSEAKKMKLEAEVEQEPVQPAEAVNLAPVPEQLISPAPSDNANAAEDVPSPSSSETPPLSDEDMDMPSYFSDDDDDDDVFLGTAPGPRVLPAVRLQDKFLFDVMSVGQTTQCISTIITDTAAVLDLPKAVTKVLLNHFKWEKNKLLEAYFGGDKEKLFENAGIRYLTSDPVMENPSNSLTECPVCTVDVEPAKILSLKCGHLACTDCWSVYLRERIADGANDCITCLTYNCPVLIGDATILSLVPDDFKERFRRLQVNSFVQNNPRAKACPGTDCKHVVLVDEVDWKPVTCTRCAFTFCFQCTEKWHEPVKCDVLKTWLKKCQDDSETSNWIASNTKECPKCKNNIEKNGGCNHMVCRSCHHQFCWVCLGAWNQHGAQYYNCTRYNSALSKDVRNAQDKSRADLHRYLFYYNRYANHMQSLKLENELYANIETRMIQMQQESGISWVDAQSLKKAVDVLCRCRQTLMYTYAFAFYVESSGQSHIFEDNQVDLQTATETLSEYLERDLVTAEPREILQRVMNHAEYCEGRRKVLVAHVYEGYESGKNWW